MAKHGAGGRKVIDLTLYQMEIIALLEMKVKNADLCKWLREEYGVVCSDKTLRRNYRSWGIKRFMSEELKQHLKNRVLYLFFALGLEDDEMLRLLKHEGTPVSRMTLVRLRFSMNMKRRIRDEIDREAHAEVAREAVQEHLLEGIIDGYGKRMLQLHFRQRGMFFARDLLFKEYAALNPEAVKRRLNDHQRRRGEYIVPGPNWCWSIDGHEKIKAYGIEIYACIDAYSRYVIWAYVGITAGTALSVLHQYLYTVGENSFGPQFIRSDCGVETGQISYAHFMLSKANTPTLDWGDCYMFGTSTSNQRIESWWQQLSKGLLFRWRVRGSSLPLDYLIDYYRSISTTSKPRICTQRVVRLM